ncbi:MAG TPA: cytochrome c oxidase assembly factor Coa1 family protein, partial [Pyrinomonadaceae bacterium]|nr:cytochrome c oxidase assembly factor Coa1 family protein [Pyrinomonadaceae bacterium]
MICNNCGNTIDPSNKFCPKCGAPVQPPSPPMGPGPSYTPPGPPYTAPGPSYAPPQMPAGPPVQPARKSSCGKIILIVGIILSLLTGAIAAAIYFGYRYLDKTLKNSEPYTLAVNALKADPQVKERLGDITETGFPLGAFTTNADGSGDAAFTMSVKGTKGSGHYQVELKRRNHVWRIENGFVSLSSGEIITVASQSRNEDADDVNSNADLGSPDEIDTSDAISGGVLNGKAISLPKPAYPPIAKQVKASGTVVIQVIVDEEGDVISARPVSGHPLLQAVALAAAHQAKFPPTKRGGQ